MNKQLRQSLDRWLTTHPNDGFNDYYEMVVEEFTESFYNQYEDDLDGDRFDKWIDKLMYQGNSPKQTANKIERMFKIYKP